MPPALIYLPVMPLALSKSGKDCYSLYVGCWNICLRIRDVSRFHRANRLQRLGCQLRAALPENVRRHLHSSEKQSVKSYSNNISSYITKLDINLTVVTMLPRSLTHRASDWGASCRRNSNSTCERRLSTGYHTARGLLHLNHSSERYRRRAICRPTCIVGPQLHPFCEASKWGRNSYFSGTRPLSPFDSSF